MASTPAERMLDIATPARTRVIFAAPVRSAMNSTSSAAAIAPRKAAAGTSTCEVGAIAQQSAAASPAPEFTPIVLGAASGVREHALRQCAAHGEGSAREYAAADARQPGVQHDPRLGGAVVPAEEGGHNVPGCHAHRPEGKAEHSRERGRERKRSEKPPHFFIFAGRGCRQVFHRPPPSGRWV